MSGTQQIPPTKYTTQEMQNYGFDEQFHQPTTEMMGYDPTSAGLRPLQTDPLGNLQTPTMTLQLDYVSGTNPVYVGSATPGSATSAASWQIRKLTFDGNNNVTAIQYAGGTPAFNQIWDNRASLSYS